MRLVECVVETEDVDALVAALDAVGDRHGVTVQAFDARYVADRAHLERAVELADRERGRGEAIARDRGVEILLYAAGRRQIDRALEMGVAAGRTPVVVLVDAGPSETDGEAAAAAAVRDLDAGEPGPVETGDPERLQAFFDVGDAELAAADGDLAALVRERVALLVVER
ncbi:MAG: KEOPS complex subunit Cgi121 [Haloferacaceae archaeon]